MGKGCDSVLLDCATYMYTFAHNLNGFESNNNETYITVSKPNEVRVTYITTTTTVSFVCLKDGAMKLC